jgi:hypothetical protein
VRAFGVKREPVSTNNQSVQIMTRRFAFDRKTAELVNCCGASVKQSG